MGMAAAFSSYCRAVAVVFACAFAGFFAQESQSLITLVLGSVTSAITALMLWLRLRGTIYRFWVGVAAIIAATFLTFLTNKAYPETAFATITALLWFASFSFFALYAFLEPRRKKDGR
jgi:hypothetical protein